MSANHLIDLYCFGTEIGRIGMDENAKKSFFQYNQNHLKSGEYTNLFPLIFKRKPGLQVFDQFYNESFRGLPSIIADSLPDAFGNIIFKTWLESKQTSSNTISVLEQLTYVANRGMGALEYRPIKELPKNSTFDLDEIVRVLKLVLANKSVTREAKLDNMSLLNIFKMGTSAGGVRPKILISENKQSKEIIPGDVEYSDDYVHYLVKLNLDNEVNYPRETIEYSYYLTAQSLGIQMMESKMIDHLHFATQRFDRQHGKKKHILSASGMTGWDYKSAEYSSYENLFDLANYLKLSFKEMDELFRRMVFNVVFFNHDDHLKNHSFIYDEEKDKWNLSPAYDLTFSLNPMLTYTRTPRALSINKKRTDIELKDLLSIANKYTIKNPKRIIESTQDATTKWEKHAKNLGIPKMTIQNIQKHFQIFI
jgi:serine/threonine-protein kinase HipA